MKSFKVVDKSRGKLFEYENEVELGDHPDYSNHDVQKRREKRKRILSKIFRKK